MTESRWIVIDRWDDFQHPDAMRSNVPPWIKTYTSLLASDEFLELSFHLRGVLLSLWLEYAVSGGQVKVSQGSGEGQPEVGRTSLQRRLGHRVWSRDLQALNRAGFIHFSASKPASNRASRPASLDKRREETPLPPSGKSAYNCPNCGVRTKTLRGGPRSLEGHLTNVHWLEGDELEQALAEAER